MRCMDVCSLKMWCLKMIKATVELTEYELADLRMALVSRMTSLEADGGYVPSHIIEKYRRLDALYGRLQPENVVLEDD